MKKKLMLILLLLFTMLFNIVPTRVYAAKNLVPDYEVKLLLDSTEVLNSDNLLKKNFRENFDIGKSYDEASVLYVDTSDLLFNQAGWNNRIRIKEDSNKFELTYKRRYAISNSDITSALNKANSDGFDINDTDYEAQVDWGYNKMTLSLSYGEKKSNSGYKDLKLPGKDKSISMLKDNMPDELESLGKKEFKNGKVFGPITYLKYKGSYENTDVDIEIWPIYNEDNDEIEYITELSFKSDSYNTAASVRSDLIKYLDSLGVLLHRDSLKTQMILNNY